MSAAAMISVSLMRLYVCWQWELFLSYQSIWSSRRSRMGSETVGMAAAAFMAAHCKGSGCGNIQIPRFNAAREPSEVAVDPLDASRICRRRMIVRSKLKCPLFIASEMSGFSFGFIHKPVVVAAVGKWESRVLGGISKRGGKVGFGAFPRSVFSTAFFAAFSVEVMAAPWGL